MEIRRYDGVEDLEGAVDAHNRAWRVGFRGIVPQEVIDDQLRATDDAALAVLDQELSDEPGVFGVAEVDGSVVGYVRLRYGGTYRFVPMIGAEVVELVVDPAHWRDGIGTALLKHGVDWLPDTVDGVTVDVLADDERARSFLEANDLVHEETEAVELLGEPVEHAVYRVRFED